MALILGLLTNLAAVGSVVLSVVILLSQRAAREVGHGPRGTRVTLTINVLVALILVIIVLSPAAKALFSVDAILARRSPALSSPPHEPSHLKRAGSRPYSSDLPRSEIL